MTLVMFAAVTRDSAFSHPFSCSRVTFVVFMESRWVDESCQADVRFCLHYVFVRTVPGHAKRPFGFYGLAFERRSSLSSDCTFLDSI